MTSTAKVLLTTAALALGAAGFAGASVAGGWGHHHGRGHHGGFGGERLFENFDANDDGTITQAEVDEVRQSRLAEFDQDDDGSLSLEEYQALWMDAMRERMVDRFQAHDDDGDGLVTAEEFGDRYSGMVERLDQDGDGELTRQELRRRGDRRGHDRDREHEEG